MTSFFTRKPLCKQVSGLGFCSLMWFQLREEVWESVQNITKIFRSKQGSWKKYVKQSVKKDQFWSFPKVCWAGFGIKKLKEHFFHSNLFNEWGNLNHFSLFRHHWNIHRKLRETKTSGNCGSPTFLDCRRWSTTQTFETFPEDQTLLRSFSDKLKIEIKCIMHQS